VTNSSELGSEKTQQSSVPATKSLFICVGDLSADQHAGKLISKLKAECPNLHIWGVGGECMKEAGVDIIYDREKITAIGLVEVIRYLPRLIMARSDLYKRIIEKNPDALLLMDFGGFNVGFATLIRKKLKKIPIIYFISPQVWGSRPWRIDVIAAAVSKMLVIFPFEEAIYRKKGVNATFVGHPVTLEFKPEEERQTRAEFCKQHGLDPERPIIGIFPGSRKQEIACHAQVVLDAIEWLRKERAELQFVVASTNQTIFDAFQLQTEKLGYGLLMGKTIKTISSEHNEELMTHSDILWAKSGTTTLEATLIGTPMLIFYRGSWITFFFVMIFKIIKYVGWPNLLHGEGIVPELIQLDCRAEQLVKYTCDWLDVPALRKEISSELKVLKSHLGDGDFTDNAAREILSILNQSKL
jgi:lipid-A-disaccharide synthase